MLPTNLMTEAEKIYETRTSFTLEECQRAIRVLTGGCELSIHSYSIGNIQDCIDCLTNREKAFYRHSYDFDAAERQYFSSQSVHLLENALALVLARKVRELG